jgi:hypothetical protein
VSGGRAFLGGRALPGGRSRCRDRVRRIWITDRDHRRQMLDHPRGRLGFGLDLAPDPGYHRRRGRLAQLVERLPYKEEVGGSSPSPPIARTADTRGRLGPTPSVVDSTSVQRAAVTGNDRGLRRTCGRGMSAVTFLKGRPPPRLRTRRRWIADRSGQKQWGDSWPPVGRSGGITGDRSTRPPGNEPTILSRRGARAADLGFLRDCYECAEAALIPVNHADSEGNRPTWDT